MTTLGINPPADPPLNSGGQPNQTVYIYYTNWKGETAWRDIIPLNLWFGSTEWHPKPQWLLKALDVQKQAERDFSMKSIHVWIDGEDYKRLGREAALARAAAKE